jgi:L-seryl-tRNA(Ser) seleniumtransferase
MDNKTMQNLLKNLPKVDKILHLANEDDFFKNIPKTLIINSIREVIEKKRANILSKKESKLKSIDISESAVLSALKESLKIKISPNLFKVINATGVVIHTNLGRSLLAKEALEHILSISNRYSNLEYDIETGKRGKRYSIVEDLICEISGSEAAMVVNNNAAAVFVCLDTIAQNKEVIISRGELVEIGDSFRIPDIMKKSGSILREVGTTNRTHVKDYENAINENTGLLLKVHKSNYAFIGFAKEVSLNDLAAIGRNHNICVMEDLGSGSFIDFSKFGMDKEPTIQESVSSGADIVTFSGDKLLGGPQAGIIAGKKDIIDNIRKNPLTRAVRIDKLTLAALEATLRIYRDQEKAVKTIPTIAMLTMSFEKIRKKAENLQEKLKKIDDERLNIFFIEKNSKAGGGSLPAQKLPSCSIGIKIDGFSASFIEKNMRLNAPHIIGTIENDIFLMDLRTVVIDEIDLIKDAIIKLLKKV